MFAITHCVYYRCLMNGFNNIEQNYLNPLEFCPICFRKIVKNIGFDKGSRYQNLIRYCKESELKQLQIDKKLYEELLGLNKVKTIQEEDKPKTILVEQNKTKVQNNQNNRGRSLQVGIRRR